MGDVVIPPILGVHSVTAPGTFTGYVSNVIERAPGSLLVYISGATGRSFIAAEIDGQELARVQIGDDGTGSITIPISADNGAVGFHTVDLVQYIGTGSLTTQIVIQYEVMQAPEVLPGPLPAPSPPATIPPGAKWVLQDLAPGGLGSYTLPVGPSTATSPQYEHSFTSRHTTAKSGKFHIFQSAAVPKDWTFGGYAPTEEMVEKLWDFRNLNRRIYVIDDHSRAWLVAITGLDVKPRLRHFYNGMPSDWGSDWEMTVTVLSQDPIEV